MGSLTQRSSFLGGSVRSSQSRFAYESDRDAYDRPLEERARSQLKRKSAILFDIASGFVRIFS